MMTDAEITDELLTRIQGWRCPARYPHEHDQPFVHQLGQITFDKELFQRGERINGVTECPRCGLLWPSIEEPECWEECGRQKVAIEWGPGTAECLDCDICIVCGFDCDYVIDLNRPNR